MRPYKARGAAYNLWTTKAPEVLLEGPAGTGKSRGALEKSHYLAMRYPGCRVLLVRKTRESMTQTVLVTFEEHVVPEGDPILEGPQRNLRQVYRYPNGSEVVVGGMDKSTKVMSSEYDFIVVFEGTELNEEDYENLTSRLRNGKMPYDQIVVDCNPGAPQHWLNVRANQGKMVRLRSKHQDNPLLFDEEGIKTKMGKKYIKRLRRLTGHRKSRLLKGLWVAAEGIVYGDYDPELHLVPRFPIPKEWRRIRSIDFGYVNPFVCQWWAIDPDGRMFLYREVYFTHRLVQDHAKLIKRLSAGENIEATVTDHDAEDRATLDDAGIWTTPAFKDVTPGIEAVNARLRKEGDGKPRLYFLRDSLVELDRDAKESGIPTETVGEIDGYSYPKKVQDKQPKEEPTKRDDHGMDAMRYAVAYVDNLAGFSINVQADQAIAVEVR